MQIPPFGRRNFLLEIQAVDRKTRRLAVWRPNGRSRIAGDPIRQHFQRNLSASLQGDGAFLGVFELANVSRPIVGFQARHRFRGDPFNGFFHRLTEALEKVAREQGNVVPALAQGWHLYGNHAETIIEVLAEAAFRNLLFELLVRSGNDADIHIRFFRTADRADLAFLQDSIELHLHGQAHIPDLVHEERAAVGGLEKALAVFVSPSESALHITEKFGLQESLWERTTVDGDKRRLCPNAVFMNGARHQLFTGAALPGNENTARLRSNGLNHVEDSAHVRALSDDIVEPGEPPQLPTQISGFFLPFEALGDFMHSKAQLID